jgi:hypothetical protein
LRLDEHQGTAVRCGLIAGKTDGRRFEEKDTAVSPFGSARHPKAVAVLADIEQRDRFAQKG